MRRVIQNTVVVLGIGAVLAAGGPVSAQDATQKAIGLYMAVIGKTTVVHVGQQPVTVPVKLRENVYFKDVIETQAAARTKALFDDDSILTVGENSRVEVSEYIYDPANNRRSAVLRLVQGKVRALVGRLFVELGSRFEVHTPTAVTAARGTYFVVWIEEKASGKLGKSKASGTGIANIGNSGLVAFTSGKRTVEVSPGYYSIAPQGGPPSIPVQIASNAPPGVTGAIQGTELPDVPLQESPNQAVAALGQTTRLLGVEPGQSLGQILPTSTLTPLQTGLTPPSVVSGSGLNALLSTTGGVTSLIVPGGLIVPGTLQIPGVILPPGTTLPPGITLPPGVTLPPLP